MNDRLAKVIKHPMFLLVATITVIWLIFSFKPSPETYDGKLRQCIDMCRESNRFGRLVAPKRISPKNTIKDYQCQCY